MKLVKSGQAASGDLLIPSLRNCRLKLAELICMTENMLELARAQDWDGLEALEQTRQREFAHYHVIADAVNDTLKDVEEEESSLIAEALATLIYLNDQIKDRVKSAREAVLQSGQQHQGRKQAITSYQEGMHDYR